MSHAGFLRSDAPDQAELLAVVRTLWRQGQADAEASAADRLEGILAQLPQLPGLSMREQALLAFAARLTVLPSSSTRDGVAALREAGLGERSAFDVVAIVSLFAFMNRIADGTGVAIQPAAYAWAEELLGADALAAHLAWAAAEAPD